MARFRNAVFAVQSAIRAVPCQLSLFTGANNSGSALWIQLFNKAGPVNGDTPVQSIYVPDGANWTFAPSANGGGYDAACWWATSSTQNTLTLTALSVWAYWEGTS